MRPIEKGIILQELNESISHEYKLDNPDAAHTLEYFKEWFEEKFKTPKKINENIESITWELFNEWKFLEGEVVNARGTQSDHDKFKYDVEDYKERIIKAENRNTVYFRRLDSMLDAAAQAQELYNNWSYNGDFKEDIEDLIEEIEGEDWVALDQSGY